MANPSVTSTGHSLPTGTVIFLFTHIEDSTRLWQEQPEAMSTAHRWHDAILREAVASNNGYIFQIVGDSFSAAFHNAIDGLRAALSAQRALQKESESIAKRADGITNSQVSLRVRMGLDTAAAELLRY